MLSTTRARKNIAYEYDHGLIAKGLSIKETRG